MPTNRHAKTYSSSLASTVATVHSAIRNLIDGRNRDGHIIESEIAKLLCSLAADPKTHGAIPLEVKARNAGIVISRSAVNLPREHTSRRTR